MRRMYISWSLVMLIIQEGNPLFDKFPFPFTQLKREGKTCRKGGGRKTKRRVVLGEKLSGIAHVRKSPREHVPTDSTKQIQNE